MRKLFQNRVSAERLRSGVKSLLGLFLLLLAASASALTLTAPANGAITYMNYPGLFWDAVPGAEKYEVQIATSSAFSNLVVTDFIEVARYVPAGGLPAGASYYWRVRDLAADGQAGVWSEVRMLTVNSHSGLPVYTIPPGASVYEAREQFFNAAADAPAIVAFATNTTYRFNPTDTNGYPWVRQGVHAFITYWFKTGVKSLRAQHATVQSSSLSQVVTLKPGTNYTFAGSIRFGAIAGAGAGARFNIQMFDEQGAQVGQTNTPYVKQSWGDWINQTLTFITPSTVSYALVSCEVNQLSGDVVFDAVEAREVGVGANRILDGSFENFDMSNTLMVRDASNLFIEGNGSTLIIEARAQALRLERSSSAQVSGLTIDYDPIQHTVCAVDSVNAAQRSIDVTVFDGYPDLDHAIFTGVDLAVVVQDPAVPGQLKKNTYSGHYQVTATALGNHRFRLSGLRSGSGMNDFVVGDRVLINARSNGTPVFGGFGLNQVTFANCAVLSGVASPFSIYQSSEITLLGCGTKIAPGRYYSSNADGMHFYDHRIGPWVEDCLFEAQGDDGVNFKTHGLWVSAQVATNQLSLYKESSAALIEVGDKLMIVDTDVVASVVEATVTAITVGTTNVLVTVDRDVGVIETGKDLGDTQVYNRSRATGNFVIHNSIFRKNRARGLSIQTDGLVVGNTIEGVSGRAINIVNYLDWGVEGFVAPGTKVLRNTIKECGFDRETTGGGGASIDISVIKNTGALAAYRGQKQIQIKSNTITDWNCAAVKLYNGDGCEVSGNSMGNSKYSSFITASNYPITVGNTANSWIHDNTVTDTRAMPTHLNVLTNTLGIWLFAPGSVPVPTSQPSGFSSVQGEDGWFYQYYTNGAWQNLAWSTNGYWQGPLTWARIYASYMHPHTGQDVAMVWQARDARWVNIGGMIRKGSAGGDGVQVKILKNTTQIWPASGWVDIAQDNTNGLTVAVGTSVNEGDRVYFILNSKSNQNSDGTVWTPTIAEDMLANWAATQFSTNELSDPAISGNSADPDHDGMPNLLEYVFGTTPLQAEASPIEVAPSSAQFSFLRRKEADFVTVGAQFSSDMVTWVDQPLPANVQDAGMFERLTFAAPDELRQSRSLFFRVLTTIAPN